MNQNNTDTIVSDDEWSSQDEFEREGSHDTPQRQKTTESNNNSNEKIIHDQTPERSQIHSSTPTIYQYGSMSSKTPTRNDINNDDKTPEIITRREQSVEDNDEVRERKRFKSTTNPAISTDTDTVSPFPASSRSSYSSSPVVHSSPSLPAYHPSIFGCRSVHSSYERLNTIDEGTYGVVHRAKCKDTGEVVALKKVKLDKNSPGGFPITSLREVNILLSLKHPNIIELKEIVVGPGVNPNGIYMVMEYMDHDVKQLMKTMKTPFRLVRKEGKKNSEKIISLSLY